MNHRRSFFERISIFTILFILLMAGCQVGFVTSPTETPTFTATQVSTLTPILQPTLTPTPYIWPWVEETSRFVIKDGGFFGWDGQQKEWNKFVVPEEYELTFFGQKAVLQKGEKILTKFNPTDLMAVEINSPNGKISVVIDGASDRELFVKENSLERGDWVMAPMELLGGLPAWSKPELDIDLSDGQVVYRDVKARILAKLDPDKNHWVEENLMYYSCGLGSYGGTLVEVDKNETIFQDGGALRGLTACVTGLERIFGRKPGELGIRLDMDYWTKTGVQYTFKVVVGTRTRKDSSIDMVAWGLNLIPIDDYVDPVTKQLEKGAFTRLREWFLSPTGGKVAKVFLAIESSNCVYIDEAWDLCKVVNENTVKVRETLAILSEPNGNMAKQLPDALMLSAEIRID